MSAAGDFVFGPFHLEVRLTQLRRDGDIVPLPAPYVRLLLALVSRAGEILTKDELIKAAWREQEIGDGSLIQAIFRIRRALDPDNSERYIATATGRGYRFVTPVTRTPARTSDVDIDAILAPHEASNERRTALETLQLDRIRALRAHYEALLAANNDTAKAHLGLAAACLAQFEATRANGQRDVELLRLAVHHAREAVRLDVTSADAYATLGVALDRSGERSKALAALRHAVALAPGDCHRYVQLAWVAWGRDRLDAAMCALLHLPGCAIAHWLAATVYIARNALVLAERHVDAGIAALPADGQASDQAFPAIALFLLKGLLLLVRGDVEGAMAAFERELALESSGHIYARETAANAWYGIGVCRWLLGDKRGAREAFSQAVARTPGHHMALAGLAILSPRRGRAASGAPECVDDAMGAGARLVAKRDVKAAARLIAAALADAPVGHAGWMIPIDPLLAIHREPDAWVDVLRLVHDRAR